MTIYTSEQHNAWFADFQKGMEAIRANQAKTDEQLQKTDEQLQRTDEQLAKTDAQLQKTDVQLEKTTAQMAKSDLKWEKISAKIDRLGKYYGDSENAKGEEVEDFFYRHFQAQKRIGDIRFDDVDRNIISSDGSEHDIVLINGEVSALVSVKYKLKKEDIDYLVDTELERLKHFYHRLGSKHKLYGGVASYIVSAELEHYANDRGVYVFARSGDNVQTLNKETFEPIVL